MLSVCGCDPDRVLEFVYLGPNEGLEHQIAVHLAKESFIRARNPDFQIKSKSDPTYRVAVQKTDVIRESMVLRKAILSRQNRQAVSNMLVDDPVLPVHLDYICQFLYTGDYAIETGDVEDFPIDKVKHPHGCSNCENHLRLLSFHLSLFHAARYLGMEMLQLLAMCKLAAAAEHATSTVLRYILQDVYTIEPATPMEYYLGTYSLVDWLDYRPLMILPAVMEYIRKHKPAIQMHYDDVVTDGRRTWVERVRAGWPEPDQFEAMRNQIPDFNRDMKWADIVLAQEDENPRLIRVSEPTKDLLDGVDRFVLQTREQQR